MRVSLVYALVLLLVIPVSVQPAMAITEMAIPFVTTCDSVFMQPTMHASSTIVEFNNVKAADADRETLNIDFPAYFDGLHLGASVLGLGVADADANDGAAAAGAEDGANPAATAAVAGIADALGIGATATANVLPFGPVNLALPDIRQTVYETHAYQRTYFFADFTSF